MIKYEGLGLDNIWLMNGYKYIQTGYGPALVVENHEKLGWAVADYLVEQNTVLTGQEFRLIREILRMTQDAFAKIYGRDYQSVARWEDARHKPVPKSADAFMRLLYLERRGKRPIFTETVEKIQKSVRQAVEHESISFHEKDDGTWQHDRNAVLETL